tara:strand:- start:1411 stop:2157 length:747 start_codon:yes stop_codon:yes gene_type:complete
MKEKNGLEIFAVWIILVQLASRAPTRGVLADEKGVGYTLEDMELYTDVSLEAFERTMPFLTKLGWVCYHDGNALPSRSHCVATAVATTVHNSTEQNKTIQVNGNKYVSNSQLYTEKESINYGWSFIPKNRQKGKGKFQTAWIVHVIECDIDLAIAGNALSDYYDSTEGKGEFWRTPARLIDDEIWEEDRTLWGSNRGEIKFSESPFEHDKIIHEYCEYSPDNVKIVETLRNSGLDNGRIAYKIWSKKI